MEAFSSCKTHGYTHGGNLLPQAIVWWFTLFQSPGSTKRKEWIREVSLHSCPDFIYLPIHVLDPVKVRGTDVGGPMAILLPGDSSSSKGTVTVFKVCNNLILGPTSVCILLYNQCKTCDSHCSRILLGSAWFWSLFSGHHSHLPTALPKTKVLHRGLHVHMTQHLHLCWF